VAAPQGKAKGYAALFEEIYRSFYMHFSIRGFKVQNPEFPLVAIIFPNHASFAKYAKQDDVDARLGLMGYYMRTTNRVALFEGESPRKASGNFVSPNELPKSADVSPLLNGHSWGEIEGGLRDTLIHEATHQVAFNVGLHARIGQNPKWIVEGLATVFEADGIRDSSKGRQIKYRINRDRFVWFQNYAKTRHKKGALESFIRNDSMFKSQTLDAYAFSWALSFFLIETRPRQYSNLLKQLGSREPLSPLSEEERVTMFKKTIGSNLKLMDAEMLRFFNRIK
jgi:hypothetical protein